MKQVKIKNSMKLGGLLLFIVGSLCLLSFDLSAQSVKSSFTPSGYKLTWIEKGEGEHPVAGGRVFFHLQYSINDSVVFDSKTRGDVSSMELPSPDDPEIRGEPLFEALYMMVPGDIGVVIQTIDQLNQPISGLTEKDELRTRVEFVDFKTAIDYEAELQAIRDREPEVRDFVESVWWNYVSGEYGDELTHTESGIKYIVHQKGNGPAIQIGDRISLHYFGKIIESARNFDNSYVRAREFSFELGAGMVIEGWEKVLPLFNKGDIVSVFIPWTLAYGERGRPPLVPGKSDLLFYFEIAE